MPLYIDYLTIRLIINLMQSDNDVDYHCDNVKTFIDEQFLSTILALDVILFSRIKQNIINTFNKVLSGIRN